MDYKSPQNKQTSRTEKKKGKEKTNTGTGLKISDFQMYNLTRITIIQEKPRDLTWIPIQTH